MDKQSLTHHHMTALVPALDKLWINYG